MIEISTILCPIDFSEHSRRALHHAVAIARWYESTVTVLHVYAVAPLAPFPPGSPILESAYLTPEDHTRLTGEIRRFAETARTAGVPVEIVLREGPVAREILDQAARADLLVIGTHGRSGFDRLVLGSVTEKVLRKAACPVLSVPPHATDAVAHAPVAFKRILCPVDFSDCSTHALNYAMSLAQEADAGLTVLHVITYEMELTPDMSESLIAYGHLNAADFRKACEENSRERLKAAVPDAVRAYCSVDTVLTPGTPYREILRVAAEQQTDLIVMGVQGRGAADLMFFGSTTQHVVRQATCPVLTIRHA